MPEEIPTPPRGVAVPHRPDPVPPPDGAGHAPPEEEGDRDA